MSDPLGAQLLRFSIVGMGNTAFGYGVYCLGLFLGLPYWLASLVALLLGIFVSFAAQKRFVFKSSIQGRLGKFVVIWAMIYGVNIGFIRVFAGFGFGYYIAGALAMAPTVILSFLSSKYVVFRRDP